MTDASFRDEIRSVVRRGECPTCPETFDSETAVKIHHKRAHGESIAGVSCTCAWCGETFPRVPAKARKYDTHFCNNRCKEKHRLTSPARLELDSRGYERWRVFHDGDEECVYVHQLLAIAEGESPRLVFGDGQYVVHHKNEIQWDNRAENIEAMDHRDHTFRHLADRYEYDEEKWRDEEALRRAVKKHSVRQLSERWGCDPRTLYRWLERYEIAPPSEHGVFDP